MAGARWNRGSMRCVVKRNSIRVHFSDRARCFGVRHFETTKLRNYETLQLRKTKLCVAVVQNETVTLQLCKTNCDVAVVQNETVSLQLRKTKL